MIHQRIGAQKTAGNLSRARSVAPGGLDHAQTAHVAAGYAAQGAAFEFLIDVTLPQIWRFLLFRTGIHARTD